MAPASSAPLPLPSPGRAILACQGPDPRPHEDRVLCADPAAIEIENNVQAALDRTKRGLRVTNVRDVHAAQSGEMLNSPKLSGEVRHSCDSRSRPKSGRSKHGVIPAMLYPGNARILPRAAQVNDATLITMISLNDDDRGATLERELIVDEDERRDSRQQSRAVEIDLVHGFSTNSPSAERDTQGRSLPLGNCD